MQTITWRLLLRAALHLIVLMLWTFVRPNDVEHAIPAFAKAGPDELDTLDSDNAALVKQTLDAAGGRPMECAELGPCDMHEQEHSSAEVLNALAAPASLTDVLSFAFQRKYILPRPARMPMYQSLR
ncbi:hypothetical protein C8R45DRAFT_1089194 [Mycena sanguinolenta]|nr:hypothetical protein C8R45DRAFT_1089194 [Mycena sanguinolenta]